MNWEAIGAVGEILGAGAVFVSLVYLAVQIRGQNKESRALAIHEISEAFRNSITPFTDTDVAAAFAQLESGDEISNAQRVQLNGAAQKLLRVWEEAFHQRNGGRLDEKVWNVIELQYQHFLASNAMRQTWAIRKDCYDPDFRDYVDSLEDREYVYKHEST